MFGTLTVPVAKNADVRHTVDSTPLLAVNAIRCSCGVLSQLPDRTMPLQVRRSAKGAPLITCSRGVQQSF